MWKNLISLIKIVICQIYTMLIYHNNCLIELGIKNINKIEYAIILVIYATRKKSLSALN